MPPYISLGIYHPTRPWKAYKIGRDLTQITKEFGLVPINDSKHSYQLGAWRRNSLCAYVRRRTVRNPKAATFHQDGDLVSGSKMDNSIVLWTSNTPTEIRDNEGKIWTPLRHEVVLIRNLSCFHRRPPICPRIRYLFRQRVENI